MSKIAFLFPGQGAQYVGMGKDFYEAFPVCREVFEEASKASGLDIPALCFEENDKLNQTVGDISACIEGGMDREATDSELSGGVICDGLGSSFAALFGEVADLTGIILTKLDGTAKGGIAVAIQSELNVPVKYIGVGEHIDDLQKFDADTFVNALFLTETED